jgi:hypothetical protein
VIDGGVVFDDLEPDVYNIAELMPDGIASVFILECTGHIMGVLQPYPLQFGPVLDDIDLDAGEHLVCHWYNVPEEDGGSLTLFKYTCSTEDFVSEVDCQIEEGGVTFDLLAWDGDSWEVIDTTVTDGFGRIGWTGLAPGDYWLNEHDGDWCHLASEQLANDDASLAVEDAQESIVHVYNCDGTPGDPGDTPTKYPNTGVPPEPATPVSSPRRHTRRPSAAAAVPCLRRDRRPSAGLGSRGSRRHDQGRETLGGTFVPPRALPRHKGGHAALRALALGYKVFTFPPPP